MNGNYFNDEDHEAVEAYFEELFKMVRKSKSLSLTAQDVVVPVYTEAEVAEFDVNDKFTQFTILIQHNDKENEG